MVLTAVHHVDQGTARTGTVPLLIADPMFENVAALLSRTPKGS